jgi:hypothetical protein
MNDLPSDPINAAWLVRAFDIMPMGRLPVLSQVGGAACHGNQRWIPTGNLSRGYEASARSGGTSAISPAP